MRPLASRCDTESVLMPTMSSFTLGSSTASLDHEAQTAIQTDSTQNSAGYCPAVENFTGNALPLWTCPDCGGAVTNPRHVRCEACIAADPAQTSAFRGKRNTAMAARKRALTEWDKAHSDTVYDPELFRRDSCRGSGRYRLARSSRRPGAPRRPHLTTGGGSGGRTCRPGRRSPSWSTRATDGGLSCCSKESSSRLLRTGAAERL
jgi:hypothetical protein